MYNTEALSKHFCDISLNFSGHSDVVMGACATNSEEKASRLIFLQNGRLLLALILFVEL